MPRARRWLYALLVTALCSGCARALGEPGAVWRRVRSPHFTLHTDLPERRARAQTALLERYLSAYLQHGWDLHGETPGRLNVVIFASPRGFSELDPRGEVDGYYATSLFEPWAVLPASQEEGELRILLHELSHHLAYTALQNQPLWYAEGIATYFESARFEGEKFVLGVVPRHAYRTLMAHGLLSPAKLFATTESRSPGFYANGWLLVHFLLSEHAARFGTYQRALAAGSTHDLAWSQAFPDLTDQHLAQALEDYARGGRFYRFTRTVEAKPLPLEVEALSVADQHALRALLLASCWRCENPRESSRDSIRRALAIDPQHVEATALASAEGMRDTTLEQVRALSRAKPRSWLAWLSLAHVAGRMGLVSEAFEAVQRALTLEPRQAHARMLAAELYVAAGQRDDALGASATALQLRPTDLGLLLRRAVLLAEVEECAPLRPTLQTIAAVSHRELPEPSLALLRRALSRCPADGPRAHPGEEGLQNHARRSAGPSR